MKNRRLSDFLKNKFVFLCALRTRAKRAREKENPLRRFWDHIIRDQSDHNAHLDYIHFNAVKHGYAAHPVDYPWSSFGSYLEQGIYQSDWGCNGGLPHLAGVDWE